MSKTNSRNIITKVSGCSLDETNPGGFTMDNLATSEETYSALVNQTFFGMERHLYGTEFHMDLNFWKKY